MCKGPEGDQIILELEAVNEKGKETAICPSYKKQCYQLYNNIGNNNVAKGSNLGNDNLAPVF